MKVFVDCAHVVGKFDIEARNRTYLRRNMLPAMASIRREDTIIHMLGEESEGPEDWGKRAGWMPVVVLFVATIFIS
jgi:hypothetical protein